MEIQQSIKVGVRVRPSLLHEIGKEIVVQTIENTILVDNTINHYSYTFDSVMGQEFYQDQVFEFVSPVIDHVPKGINATILAYGQTGTGKTYTMFGYKNEARELMEDRLGVIPRAVDQLFNRIMFEEKSFTILASFIQLYNEKIYDLIQDPKQNYPLNIKENLSIGIFIEGLTEYVVQNSQECLALIEKGERNRVIRSTRMSFQSSRSHSIFQIQLESDYADSKGNLKRAKLNLCDLAGSEKFEKKGEMTLQHIRELNSINISLTTLRKVVLNLSKRSRGVDNCFVPYRDSKLTRMLTDSLGGNTRTVFIATVSPIRESIEETISTLKFATSARQINNKVSKNLISSTNNEMINKLQREIKYLRDLLHMRRQGGTGIKQIQNRLIILQEENNKLRQITQEQINQEEILKLKEENKQMRIWMQQCLETGDLGPIQQEMSPSTVHSTLPSITASRSQSQMRASNAPFDRQVEVRIRGRNASVETQFKTFVNTFDDQLRDQRIRQQNRRTLQHKKNQEIQRYVRSVGTGRPPIQGLPIGYQERPQGSKIPVPNFIVQLSSRF